jgi:hypothetical protein
MRHFSEKKVNPGAIVVVFFWWGYFALVTG